LSIVAQVILGDLMRVLGAKKTIIVGLTFEMFQLLWYGVGSQTWYGIFLLFSLESNY
jgi:hypothetical protein